MSYNTKDNHIVKVSIVRKHKYHATCSCGWTSELNTRQAVRAIANKHVGIKVFAV
jgi:hypothetical protein